MIQNNRKVYILEAIHLIMIKGTNKYKALVESLQGYYTVQTLAERLKIERTKAIYVIHRLRKLGVVKTTYGADKKRGYYISLRNKQKGVTYLEEFNENMPNAAFKIGNDENYFVHGRKLRAEELLIYALKKNKIRYIISALFLFRKIEDWSFLYKLAKKENLLRQISALYMVACIFVKKVRRMPKRFRKLVSPKKNEKYAYIVSPYNSDDFKDIERKCKIYIPLNRADLQEYTYL